MISVSEADRLLREHARPRASIAVPLAEAGARVLREDVAADRDQPPFDRVAMDGIAVAAAALQAGRREFPVLGVLRAGAPAVTLTEQDACLEVMTGAVLPAGADTVIRYEDLTILNGSARLAEGAAVAARQNVHARASDRKQGDAVLRAGVRLHPPQIAVLAAMGKTRVQVAPAWTVAVVSTGDELVGIADPVLPHQIRRSNAQAIGAALAARGDAPRLRHAPDDEATLTATIREALSSSDALILSGGVSMGKFDLVPQVLAALGVREVFHKIAQKPGKPMWFGVTADGRPVFGLPGNPVAALVCLRRYVIPFMDACDGRVSRQAALWLRELPKGKNDLTRFVAVRRDGLEATAIRDNGSGDFAALGESDGFVEIAAGGLPAFPGGGFALPFYAWSTE